MVRRFYRKSDALLTFFVQNESSKNLLYTLGKTNVAISGDTRFDRVATILEKRQYLILLLNLRTTQ
jgi:3-deoxy-D-manno-octulosonic-acid transferase